MNASLKPVPSALVSTAGESTATESTAALSLADAEDAFGADDRRHALEADHFGLDVCPVLQILEGKQGEIEKVS